MKGEVALKDIWQIIYNNVEGRNLYLRKNWYDSWGAFTDENEDWDTLVRYEHVVVSDEVAAVIPYAFQKKGPFNFASLAGKFIPHRGIPNTGANPKLIEMTADKISQIKGVEGFRFGFVEESDEFIESLYKQLSRRNWKYIVKPYSHDLGMEVPESEGAYLKSLSRNTRKGILRKRRRFEEAGLVETKYFENEEPQVWQKVFREIEKIELASWVGSSGEPRFRGEQKQKYWNKLIEDDWFSNAIKVIIVYFDGEAVCHCVSIDSGDTRYAYDTNYHPKVSKYGVGVQLEVENVNHAIKLGLKHINYSIGDEDFKQKLGREKLARLMDVVVFAPTLKGRMAFLAVKVAFLMDSWGINEKISNLKMRVLGKN